MNREDIIRMAQEAGFPKAILELSPTALERFAALVASAEREACANLCDRFANRMMSAEECADAIRARGKHEN